MSDERVKIEYQSSNGVPPIFDWRPLEQIRPGKFLILNLSEKTKSLFISTAYIQEGMSAELLSDYLKWAIAFCEFPDITYELMPGEKEIA